MKAFIMAGGKGTRLSAITNDEIPKPMVLLAGIPLLQHAIENLKKHGVTEIYISVGHLYENIIDHFGDGKKFGVKIHYIIETTALGSAGALYYVKGKINEDFIICSGDTLFEYDLSKMMAFHKKNNADLTLVGRPNNHPYDSDLVLLGENSRVLGFDKKTNTNRGDYKNIANAGFFIANPSTLSFFAEVKKVGMEHDFITGLINNGSRVFAYNSTEYKMDVGTPERLLQAERDLANNLLTQRCYTNKQRAILLDRDGVINRYAGFITKPSQIELYPDTIDAIKMINASGYLAIVISNQPVLARGDCTVAELDAIFNRVDTLLGNQGALLNAVYYCPHHTDKGFPGEVPELKFDCDCRKPKPGLVFRAAADFNLDLSKCWFVGDQPSDMQCARNAGVRAIFMKNDAFPNTPPGEIPIFVADTLTDAIQFILKENKL
jgi:histidinol-phosphate phosphatase family protein